MQPRADEVDAEAVGVGDAVVAELDLCSRSSTTRVEESPLQKRRSKTCARPGGGGLGSGAAWRARAA